MMIQIGEFWVKIFGDFFSGFQAEQVSAKRTFRITTIL